MNKPQSKSARSVELAETNSQHIADVDRLQKEMLQLVAQTSADPISYAGLAYCGPNHCARAGCSEACWFGTRRRRIADQHAMRQLLREYEGKFYEIAVVRPRWDRKVLQEVNISAGKNLVRRVLHNLGVPGIAAAGTLKVRPWGNSCIWRYEFTFLVAGAKHSDLVKGFPGNVTPVNNVDDAVVSVLHCNEPARYYNQPGLAERKEFYAWLLNMKVGARLIRYGCDKGSCRSQIDRTAIKSVASSSARIANERSQYDHLVYAGPKAGQARAR